MEPHVQPSPQDLSCLKVEGYLLNEIEKVVAILPTLIHTSQEVRLRKTTSERPLNFYAAFSVFSGTRRTIWPLTPSTSKSDRTKKVSTTADLNKQLVTAVDNINDDTLRDVVKDSFKKDPELAKIWRQCTSLSPSSALFKLVERLHWNRCLFVTNTGLTGTGSLSAEAGDRVAGIFETMLPWILKPVLGATADGEKTSTPRFEVYGTCYIPEILGDDLKIVGWIRKKQLQVVDVEIV